MGAIANFYAAGSLYLWAALVAIVLLLAIWLITLQTQLNQLTGHYDRLTDGGRAGSIQKALDLHIERIDEMELRVDEVTRLSEQTHAGLRHTLQKVGLIRFNPFSDTGGDQSFSLALLDQSGNGIVLSSLFSRNETRIFAKPIVNGQSKYTLTDEELSAIDLARESPPSKAIH